MRATLAGVLAGLVLLAGAVAPAHGQDAPYLDWPRLLPPVPGGGFRPSDVAACRDGDPACIEATIAEMYRRLNAVVPVCDHRNVFALAYLRVTEDVRDVSREGSLYREERWIANVDEEFARLYFVAYDDWAAGRRDRVPESWQVAFGAAEGREVRALGDFLLAMNAHINRDFPFVLAGTGLVAPDGSSRKPDHDAYNVRLAALYRPVLAELARRFDPTADDYEAGPGDDELAYTILQSWREGVWRNAERLAAARDDPEERARVARSIEDSATAVGRAIRATFAYGDADGAGAAARAAFCARNGGQDPGAWRLAAATFARDVRRVLRVRRGGRLRVPIACPVRGLGCRGEVRVRRGGRTAGRRRYVLRPGGRRALGVRVGRRLVRVARAAGGRGVRVELRLVRAREDGRSAVRRRVRLRG